MNSVSQQFLDGKEERGIFGLCGKEFRQDEDFGIHVAAKDNTERVQPITFDMKLRFDTKSYSRRNTRTEIRHNLLTGSQGKHVLISHTVSQRFKARLKMLAFETCANAVVL